jgi:hypothetical protein
MVNDEQIPQSRGGELHDTNNPLSAFHTAYWGMRADYVLPSRFGVDVIGNGVFWPLKDDDTFRLIESREASSDHRLVWSTLRIR